MSVEIFCTKVYQNRKESLQNVGTNLFTFLSKLQFPSIYTHKVYKDLVVLS